MIVNHTTTNEGTISYISVLIRKNKMTRVPMFPIIIVSDTKMIYDQYYTYTQSCFVVLEISIVLTAVRIYGIWTCFFGVNDILHSIYNFFSEILNTD